MGFTDLCWRIGTKKMGSTAVLPVITSITKNLITMKKLLL